MRAHTYLVGGAGSAQRSRAAAAVPSCCNPTRQTEGGASFERKSVSKWEALYISYSVDIPENIQEK